MCTTRRETIRFWNLVRLILEAWRYLLLLQKSPVPVCRANPCRLVPVPFAKQQNAGGFFLRIPGNLEQTCGLQHTGQGQSISIGRLWGIIGGVLAHSFHTIVPYVIIYGHFNLQLVIGFIQSPDQLVNAEDTLTTCTTYIIWQLLLNTLKTTISNVLIEWGRMGYGVEICSCMIDNISIISGDGMSSNRQQTVNWIPS